MLRQENKWIEQCGFNHNIKPIALSPRNFAVATWIKMHWRYRLIDLITRSNIIAQSLCTLLLSLAQLSYADQEQAIFAGGCFWCIESDFEKIDGVTSAVSGYIGGREANPSYQQVAAGKTGHTEAVKIAFDSSIISYQELLAHFWVNIDPLDGDGQFCDRGAQYRSEIFYLNQSQQLAAQRSLNELAASTDLPGDIQTAITAASEFYIAEEYHQDYYKKNPTRYNYYRWRCGRDSRLEQLWQ